MDGARKPTCTGKLAHFEVKRGTVALDERAAAFAVTAGCLPDVERSVHGHTRLGDGRFVLRDGSGGGRGARARGHFGRARVTLAIGVPNGAAPDDLLPGHHHAGSHHHCERTMSCEQAGHHEHASPCEQATSYEQAWHDEHTRSFSAPLGSA